MKNYLVSLCCILMLLVSCKNKTIENAKMDSIESTNELILKMVNAANANDIEAIEDLRDKVKTEHIDALIPLWNIDLSWQTKDGFTFLMCDQNDPRLKPMMLEALNSPLEPSKAYGLCYLQGKDCDFDSFLDSSGFFKKEEIARQIKALKN